MTEMTERAPYQIIWRPIAETDLLNIIDYIAQDSPSSAVAFANELRATTLLLVLHPKLGRKGRPKLPSFLREWVVHPNYIVFYRVHSKKRTIEILRLKHAAQRMP